MARDHDRDVTAAYQGEGDPSALFGPAMAAGVREAVVFWVQESINRVQAGGGDQQDDGLAPTAN